MKYGPSNPNNVEDATRASDINSHFFCSLIYPHILFNVRFVSFALIFSAVKKALWPPPPLIIPGCAFFSLLSCAICFTCFSKLGFEDFPIHLVVLNKCFMVSFAGYFTFFKNNYLIRIKNAADPLSHHDND